MALVSFLPSISTFSYGTVNEPEPPNMFVNATGFIFDNGTLLMDSTGIYPFAVTAYSYVQATSTLATIRSGLIANFIASFNAELARTDGSTITFKWLDDKGIL